MGYKEGTRNAPCQYRTNTQSDPRIPEIVFVFVLISPGDELRLAGTSTHLNHSILSNQIRQFFQNFISYGDRSGVGREASLRDDQTCELGGQVNV